MSAPPPADLWQALPLPALMLDLVAIRAANPAAETFLNHSQRILRDLPLTEALPCDPPLGPALARVMEEGISLALADARLTLPQGGTCSCRVTLIAMGEAALCLIEPQSGAGRMASDQQAKAAARSAAGLAAMLAHEIKNPLAGIAGAAQLLEMGLAPGERDLTAMIVEETRRIVQLLEQVERFGNLSPPRREAANIHDILDRARRSALLGHAAHMQIVQDYDPSLPPAFVDPGQMVQVFLNLIKNGAEAAGGAPGTIRLRTRIDHGLRRRGRAGLPPVALPLLVEVQDDGPGIAPDLLPQIFDPFVSGRVNGTGLGLALVSKVIADHDGWIGVDSRPGQTAFRIALPIPPKE